MRHALSAWRGRADVVHVFEIGDRAGFPLSYFVFRAGNWAISKTPNGYYRIPKKAYSTDAHLLKSVRWWDVPAPFQRKTETLPTRGVLPVSGNQDGFRRYETPGEIGDAPVGRVEIFPR